MNILYSKLITEYKEGRSTEEFNGYEIKTLHLLINFH